jgi:hypothetical protein
LVVFPDASVSVYPIRTRAIIQPIVPSAEACTTGGSTSSHAENWAVLKYSTNLSCTSSRLIRFTRPSRTSSRWGATWASRNFTSCSKCARRSSRCKASNSASPCFCTRFSNVSGARAGPIGRYRDAVSLKMRYLWCPRSTANSAPSSPSHSCTVCSLEPLTINRHFTGQSSVAMTVRVSFCS